MPDSSPILDWKRFRITWRGGIFEMNPDPADYGGQDVRKFFLEQFQFMLNTHRYDIIDQRLVLAPNEGGGQPIKIIKKADQLENLKFPKKKRRKRR